MESEVRYVHLGCIYLIKNNCNIMEMYYNLKYLFSLFKMHVFPVMNKLIFLAAITLVLSATWHFRNHTLSYTDLMILIYNLCYFPLFLGIAA